MKKIWLFVIVHFLILGLAHLGYAQSSDTLTTAPLIWLRADKDSTVQSTSWADWRGNKVSATATIEESPLLKGELNFNKTILFDGYNDYMQVQKNLEGLSGITMISVFQSTDTTERGIWGAEKALSRDIMLSTRKVLGPDSVVDTYGKNENRPVLNTIIQSWDEAEENAADAYLAVGSAGKAESRKDIKPFKGYFAEFMVFDRVLDFMERMQVETYLAIKHGISRLTGNYVSSAEQVLWNGEDNKSFSHRITGIGRDDLYQLYQKQAKSAFDTAGFMVMNTGALAKSNKENMATINNLDFLVWGDNNKAFTDKPDQDSVLSVIDRQWMLTANGNSVSQLPTELHINKSMLPYDSLGYWLVIDRSGQGRLSVDNVEYIVADSASSTDSTNTYKNVQWDTDLSGKDAFGFARKEYMLAIIRNINHPPCYDPMSGSVAFEIMGGCAPYNYHLTNLSANKSSEWSDGKETKKEGLGIGEYFLKVKGADNFEVTRKFTIRHPDELVVYIGEDQEISPGQEISLDATASIPDSVPVTYLWESNFGFTSTEGKVTITESGVYKVTVTNKNGCTFSDEVTITGAIVKRFTVFPTIATDGNYTIGISLKEPGSVDIRIYDLKGNVYQEASGQNNAEYYFTGQIRHAGMYTVVLHTSQGVETRRLIAY
jgi:hypothetical protein